MGPSDHVAGVVHNDVEAALLDGYRGDRSVGGLLRQNVELDRAQVRAVLGGVGGGVTLG